MSAGKSTGESHKAKLPEGKDLDAVIRELVTQVESLMQHFVEEEDVESGLSPRDRQRFISAGVRNYGFIDKAECSVFYRLQKSKVA